jgi:predicted O-methyltransferase YrrM
MNRHLLGRARRTALRLRQVVGYFRPRIAVGLRWALHSHETSNYTYDLTPLSKQHIAHAVAIATATPVSEIHTYFQELEDDDDLRQAICRALRTTRLRQVTDETMPYGRRLGWYAAVRATKPRVVVETGVDKGLGAVVLCAGLLRNAAESRPGRYFGTDINPQAGYLLQPPYDSMGEILYGDSLESLSAFAEPIDLFINDSDHSRDYERREYECIESKLAAGGLILSDNAHATEVLARFSEARGRRFLFTKEQPLGHWYPGAGIGFSFI